MNRTFVKDRREGKVGEYFVADKLTLQGWKVTVVPYGNHPIYDFIAVRNREMFYGEVQWDKRSDETGNFALEIKKLRDSQAGYLFIVKGAVEPQEAWFCPLASARALAEEYPVKQLIGYPVKRLTALIPKQYFISKILTKSL